MAVCGVAKSKTRQLQERIKKKADSRTPPQEFLIIWVSVDRKMCILYKFSSKLMLPAQGPHLEQYWAAYERCQLQYWAAYLALLF